MVTVCLITFNHERFIGKAIDSILSQKTNFDFTILIADDYSTDRTREILANYQRLLPEKIELLLQERNVGPGQNWKDLITKPRSPFISYLEGDDYWTDENKLQNQVDFLQAHPDYTACGHLAYREVGGMVTSQIVGNFPGNTFTHADFSKGYPAIPSSSLVFRNSGVVHDPFLYSQYGGDRALLFLLSLQGPIKVLPFVGSVYRMHQASLESSYRKSNEKLALRNIAENYAYFLRIEPQYRPFMAAKIRWNCFYLAYHFSRQFRLRLALYYFGQTLLYHLFVWRLIRTLPPQPYITR